MKSVFYFLCILSVLAYEKIDIFSDDLSLIDVVRDNVRDMITVNSESRIAISYKTTTVTKMTIPAALKEFQFTITDPQWNRGRYSLEEAFEGIHITLTYDKQQSIENVCDIFATALPCINVKQCNSTTEYPAATIDLNDVFWTPSYLVPYSITKPTAILGKEWVNVAHIRIPSEHIHYENYHRGQCISSVLYHHDLFTIESPWYPTTTNSSLRFVRFTLNNRRDQEFTLFDSHIVDAPLIIPRKSQIDSFSSSTDVIFYEWNKEGKFDRFTANKRKILYPIRETPFFTGDVKLSLQGEALTIDGLVSARDGTYNPYLNIFDSQVGLVVTIPKGIYIDLAEMQLMYDSGKLPPYVTYVSHINTDLTYEQSSSQCIVFLIETSIYPMPPTLNFNLTIPIHFRGSTALEETKVVISPPAFFACTPVRDTSIKNSKPLWWQPAFPECNSIEVTLPRIDGEKQRKQDLFYVALSILCIVMLGIEILRYMLYYYCLLLINEKDLHNLF